MHRRSLSLITLLLIVSALPVAASQFTEQPFDDIARQSTLIVRATVGETWSAWDDAHEVIYTYATVRVHRYFGEATGPDTLLVREVGGVVDGYAMEAIGFPTLRSGQNVVLLLSQWENSTDYRIHAFNLGKYLVRSRIEGDVLVADPETQGSVRMNVDRRFGVRNEAVDDGAPGLHIEEFAAMVEAARAGHTRHTDMKGIE